jgi:hypothetical protein
MRLLFPFFSTPFKLPLASTNTYTPIMWYGPTGLDELDASNEDSFGSFDSFDDDFETSPTNSSTTFVDICCCDVCDPIHSYYSAHPRRRRIRAGLPRLFYCISIFQIATLVAATLTVTGDLCGPLPGNLVGQTTTTTTTTTPPPQQSTLLRPTPSLPLQASLPIPKTPPLALPSTLFLQQRSNAHFKPRGERRNAPIKNTVVQTEAKPNSSIIFNNAATTHAMQNSTISQLQAALRYQWFNAESTWSTLKQTIKTRAVGKVRPLNIDCNRCEKRAAPHRTRSGFNFRPFSIVMGAVLPIFLASSIIIVVGVSAVSNYVLIGPQRLVCYTLLCTFTAIFSFHFSVVQNVTASRLLDAWSSLPSDRLLCRTIVQHQIMDHQRSDILWALHAATNVLSTMLSIIGLCGCHDLHDESKSDVQQINGTDMNEKKHWT